MTVSKLMPSVPGLPSLARSTHTGAPTGLSIAALAIAIALLAPAATLSAATIYANPGDNLGTLVDSLNAGDTLVLHDGNYSWLRIKGKNGTASARITIRAEHDGQAIVDGGTGILAPAGSMQLGAVYINNSSYITVRGLAAQNGQEVVDIDGTGTGVITKEIIIQRVTAHDASPGNWHVFDVKYGSTNVLVEDCAGWGRGRYIFIAYHSTNVTFRRTWARWESTTNFNNAPRSAYGIYGATNTILENVIGFNAIPTVSETPNNYYTAVFVTSDNAATYPCDNSQILGSIFYNNYEGLWVNGGSYLGLPAGGTGVGVNTLFKDNYISSPKITGGLSSKNQGDAMFWGSQNTGTVTHGTYYNSVAGYQGHNDYATQPQPANSVTLNNATGSNADNGHSYFDFFGNTRDLTNTNINSNSLPLAATDLQADPAYNTAKYGTGGRFFIPAGSPLHGAASDGLDIGANIVYQYVNGSLTATPLWPWPMEDRILAEKGVSVTYAANGGFWNTLDGLYGPSTNTLSPNTLILNFFAVPLGQSSTLPVTVTNTGASSVTISGVWVTGTGFSPSSGGPQTLGAGAQAVFSVQFSPFGPGPAQGNLAIASDATNSPLNVVLQGVSGSTVSPSPAALDFGTVQTDQSSTFPVILTNAGTSGVNISSVSVTGAGFTLSSGGPQFLGSGTQTTFNVQFAPAAAGTAQGSLTIVGDALNSPLTISLTGTGLIKAPGNLLSGLIGTSSNLNPTNIAFATDGGKASGSFTDLGTGTPSWLQFDLGISTSISKVKMWHYFSGGRTYHDVVAQLSNTSDFSGGVTTVFNNDTDNSSGLGVGANTEYAETADGQTAIFGTVGARYIRFWSHGSTVNGSNHYVEVEAYQALNCTDLNLVKASFGKRTGQAGFDARADLTHDGVVDIRDLALAAREIPVGTVCQ